MTCLKTAVALSLLAASCALVGCRSHLDPAPVLERAEWLFGPPPRVGVDVAPLGDRPAPAPSQADLQGGADLGLYLSYGLHQNAALRAAYERWRAALEREVQVSSLPDPQFTFAQFVEELQTRTGPQQRRYGLTQPIPWFGKLGRRGAVAAAAAEEAWYDVLAVRLRVQRDIAVAYHEYAWLARALATTRAMLDLVRSLEPVVLRRIAAGSSGQEDLLRLQLEIGRRENDLASLENVRPAMSARLEAAMNWRGESPLPLPTLREPSPGSFDRAALLRAAREGNPELGRLAKGIEKGQQALELARLEKWPDLALGVDYLETGEAAAPTPGSGDDPWGLRLSFSLPIGRGRIAAAEREAARTLRAASLALVDREATLRADLEHAAFELDDAGRQVELYRETLLPRSREALEVTRASYTAGRGTLLDLFDSERALLGLENAYWRSCRDYYQSRARLEALVGGAL